MPKVSILFATYRERPEYLQLAISSILEQSFRDWELIACLEPGETNLELFRGYAAQDPRIRFQLNASRLGLPGSLNAAQQLAHGQYLARMDSDDICHPQRLAKQVAALDAQPAIDVLGTAMELMDEHGLGYAQRLYPTNHAQIVSRFVFSNALAHPTVMLRRASFAKVGFYNPQYTYSEDLELWLRAVAGGLKLANLEEPLLFYRVQRAQLAKRNRLHWQFNLQAKRLHAKAIWPQSTAAVAIGFAFLMTVVPQVLLKNLRTGFGINRLRGVRSRA